jgi:hypothetical protein
MECANLLDPAQTSGKRLPPMWCARYVVVSVLIHVGGNSQWRLDTQTKEKP